MQTREYVVGVTGDFDIEVAEPQDLAVLDALYARAYPKLLKADYPPSVLVTALPLIARAQPRLLRTGTFYVARARAEGVIGAGGWTVRADGVTGDVRHLVVDDRAVRRGVGRQLITRILKDARARGIRRMDCQATFTAVPFYWAMGFSDLGEIAIELRPGIIFPAVHMDLAL